VPWPRSLLLSCYCLGSPPSSSPWALSSATPTGNTSLPLPHSFPTFLPTLSCSARVPVPSSSPHPSLPHLPPHSAGARELLASDSEAASLLAHWRPAASLQELQRAITDLRDLHSLDSEGEWCHRMAFNLNPGVPLNFGLSGRERGSRKVRPLPTPLPVGEHSLEKVMSWGGPLVIACVHSDRASTIHNIW
jgi:hypothetical protein